MDSQKPNYYRRRIAAIIVFAVFFLFLGRNLTFLPLVRLYDVTPEKMKAQSQKIIKEKPGFYSVYYKNLNTSSSFGISPNQVETGASVNKVPIAAALYYLSSKGKMNLDEKVTIGKSEVQDYGTGSIRYQTLPATYSLRDLARLMLNESDNTAAHVLGVRIGSDVIQNMVNSWGMSQTDMADNKTTTQDEEIIFEKIYKGQIANPSLTKEMLGFMTDTEDENRLPKLLPKSATIAHKIGDGEGFANDVGLFKDAKGDIYYLGVMTSDIGDTLSQTNNTIANISKKIYDENSN
jgi:beta-lactamase class A